MLVTYLRQQHVFHKVYLLAKIDIPNSQSQRRQRRSLSGKRLLAMAAFSALASPRVIVSTPVRAHSLVDGHVAAPKSFIRCQQVRQRCNTRLSLVARAATSASKESSTDIGTDVASKFEDARWKNGTWDLSQFQSSQGKMDWDAVIDAEVGRRARLETSPESSTNEAPVLFDTSVVPWWAWVKRFHLPEAEKLNGRAAMVGYFAAYVVDAATGVGLVDQSSSFIGKMLIGVTIAGVLLVRRTEDVAYLKNLAEEWTFYDRQWQATWKEGPPRSGAEKDAKE